MRFRTGDRVRVRREGQDGLPLYCYGFVGAVGGPDGPVVVLLDDELGPEVIPLADLQPIEVTTLELCLSGLDLCQDAALRRGLVAMWQAEAEQAGLAIEHVEPMGDGVRDDVGSWTLAQLSDAGGERFVLRASLEMSEQQVVHVRATARHWDS